MKKVFSFFVPGGILFLAAILCVHLQWSARYLNAVSTIYPYLVFCIAILLGWRFNRSSLVFGVIILAFADRALLLYPEGRILQGTTAYIVHHAVMILLPINFTSLCLMKERGIFTVHGIVRTCLIALQPCALAILVIFSKEAVLRFLRDPLPSHTLFPQISLYQAETILFGCAFLIILYRYAKSRGAKENGFFWSLAMALVPLLSTRSQEESVFFFSTAALIHIVSVVETSHAMAFRDELTGLPARRALKEDLLKLPGRYTLAMLDIDHFKRFNDRHGHDVGDQVLRMVASKLAKISGGGKAFRYGGEEFTVVFPGRHADLAFDHLEELRKDIASSGFAIRSPFRPRKKPRKPSTNKKPTTRVNLTVSIGVASRTDQHSSVQDVLKAADKALYRAKKQGRNRVVA